MINHCGCSLKKIVKVQNGLRTLCRRFSDAKQDDHFLGKLHKLPFLPKRFTYKNGTTLQIDMLRHSQATAVYQIISQRMESGKMGVSQDEIPDQKAFVELMQESDVAAEIADVTNPANPSTAGVLQVTPALSCRSAAPILHGGYIILDERYEGLGSNTDLMFTYAACGMAAGYLGTLTRAAFTYPQSVMATMKKGAMAAAVVPRSSIMPGYGLSDDLALHLNFTHSIQHLPQAKLSEEEVVQRAISTTPVNRQFTKGLALSINQRVTSFATLRTSAEEEGEQVYRILTQAAGLGDGFGLDEFPTLQLFKQKFLHNRTLLVLKSKNGDTIGAAVVGPSHICRSNSPEVATLYLYIVPEYRKKGLGRAVVEFLSNHLSQIGYSGLLCDWLMTQGFPHGFLRNLGFSPVGAIPYSAYVHAQGWTPSALYFRDFKSPIGGSWVSEVTQYLAK